MAEELAGPAFYSYNLQTETKINIDELIYTLSPMDLPLLTGVGADGLGILPRVPVDNTIFYWLEDEVPLPRGTCIEALDNSETALDMATGDAVKFAVGDIIRIDDEAMKVTAIDTSTETLTVTRGVLGTSAVIHVINSEVIGLGTALPEGEIGSSNYQGRDKYSNYTQIWTKKLQVSRTEQRIPKYGVPNELNRQIANNMQSLWQGVEQAATYGVKHETTATRIRSTGGLDNFVTTNENTTVEWLTVEAIEDMAQLAYDQGGAFEFIMAKPKAFQALNNLAGNERVSDVSLEDARRGRQRARVVMTEFGDVTLVRNRWIKATEAFAYNRENFIFRVFQPLILERLAKTDDTDTYMMVTEGGFEVKGQDHMGKWTGLNTAAALPGAGLV